MLHPYYHIPFIRQSYDIEIDRNLESRILYTDTHSRENVETLSTFPLKKITLIPLAVYIALVSVTIWLTN